jgi:hypothetical protein
VEISERIRKYENLHIAFWLVKDTCWMAGVKWLGTAMIIPTVGLAFFIVFTTHRPREIYLNLAVLFWIIANSFWMITEFFFADKLKWVTIFPFAAGLVCVLVYYLSVLRSRRRTGGATGPGHL